MSVRDAFGRSGLVVVRLAVAIPVGAAAAALADAVVGLPYAPAAGWIVAAIVYLVWTWLIVGRMNADETAEHAGQNEEDSTRRASHVIMLLTSLISLAGVGYLLAAESAKGGDVAAAVVGILSVAASWFVLHTVFMLRYARLYYTGTEGGIDFHPVDKGDNPTYADFAYVAFTLGMTYQVSDTDLRDRRIRSTALSQGMLSFLLGAIILSITINLVAGLAGSSH